MKKKIPVLVIMMIANVLLVLYQNSRIISLGDLSYIVENAYRIVLGEVMYKDFGVIVATGTFFIQAILIKIYAYDFIPQVIYICFASALTILFTFNILNYLTKNLALIILLMIPAVIAGGYVIVPYPFYDVDCVLVMLISLNYLLYVVHRRPIKMYLFLAGMIAVIPILFKQNIGFAYTFSVHVILLISLWKKQENINIKTYLSFLYGTVVSIAVFAVLIQVYCGLNNYINWVYINSQVQKSIADYNPARLLGSVITVNYFRLKFLAPLTAVLILIFVNRKNFKSIPLISAILLIGACVIIPAVLSYLDNNNFYSKVSSVWLIFLALNIFMFILVLKQKKYDNIFNLLIIFIPFLIINSSLIGGDPEYSTFSFWPFFSIVSCISISLVEKLDKIRYKNFYKNLLIVQVICISILLLFYISSNYRLRFLDLNGEVTKSSYTMLKGLAAPGNYLTDFGELLEYTDKLIPKNENVVILPYQDPFYYASKRKQVFPSEQYAGLSFHKLNVSMPDSELVKMFKVYNIKWVIYKTKLQYNVNYIDNKITGNEMQRAIEKDYNVYKILNSYIIYERK